MYAYCIYIYMYAYCTHTRTHTHTHLYAISIRVQLTKCGPPASLFCGASAASSPYKVKILPIFVRYRKGYHLEDQIRLTTPNMKNISVNTADSSLVWEFPVVLILYDVIYVYICIIFLQVTEEKVRLEGIKY
jgi:hypothetical protein